MVTVDLKAYNKCYRKKLLLDIQNVFPKKIESCVIHKYSIKMFFFSHLHIREILQRFEETLIDVLGQNGRGKVSRSRPTHNGIGMSLHYA